MEGLMSHFADYMNERFGHETIEEDWGFVSFFIEGSVCFLQDIYVAPEKRRGTRGLNFLNRVTQIARERGCRIMQTQVWVNDANCSRSLRANLACGFLVVGAEPGRIVLSKEIGGE